MAGATTGRLLLRRMEAVEVPTAEDFRRGILDGEGWGFIEGRGAVTAAFIEERRRFGGISGG